MTGLLASVRDLAEAELALVQGVDIIDLKEPEAGALGAWRLEALYAAVTRLGDRAVLSATTGDLPMRPSLLAETARATAATGVAYVKVGFFAGGDHAACAAALGHTGAPLVAVLMADQKPELSLVPLLAAAGFRGAMLDTADKQAGGLRDHLDPETLARFVAGTRRHGLICGLAGSLTLDDIAPLVALGPDYLGFRGALCRGGRTAALDPAAIADVRSALASSATAAAGAHTAAMPAL